MILGTLDKCFWPSLTAECIFLSIGRPRGHRQIWNAQNWGNRGTVEQLTACVLWPLQPGWCTLMNHIQQQMRNKLIISELSHSACGRREPASSVVDGDEVEHKITRVQLCTQILRHCQGTPPPASPCRFPKQFCLFNPLPWGSWVHSNQDLLQFAPLSSLTLRKHTRGHSDTRLSPTCLSTPSVLPSILHSVYIYSPICCKKMRLIRTRKSQTC